MKGSKTVDEYILSQEKWQGELIELRKIVKATGLEENVKWGVPVYSVNGNNVLGIASFKNYVAIWFYQGVLLKDEKRVLINAQEGTTKALRQWRFTSINEINPKLIASYIREAIANEESGNKIKPSVKKELEIPVEFLELFKENDTLKQNFEKLTPFKQREYIEYI